MVFGPWEDTKNVTEFLTIFADDADGRGLGAAATLKSNNIG
jgi:hypothetical protein